MINFYAIPEQELPDSMQVMRKIMRARNWGKAEKLYHPGPSYIFATRPDGKEIRFYSSMSKGTNAFASELAIDKMASFTMLKNAGIKTPDTVFSSDKNLADFVKKYDKKVVKPLRGAHGKQVFTNLETLEEVQTAAEKITPNYSIVQEQIKTDGAELRLICINYNFVIAIERIPAAVTGDGIHNVEQLINIENETIRSEAYTTPLSKVNLDEALAYLKGRAMYIPLENEKVQVHPTCNLGSGGTCRAVLDLPDETKQLAEQIAHIFDLPVIGIDLCGDYVLEVNSNPGLNYPTGDEHGQLPVEKYVEYLENLNI